ncbi:Uncharacterized protein APZ42_023664 [Daphnia magna]|uniref:Uncharacterized protein n=1 Tax=Daphnia magna TaxID=35525 RepID=A0A164UUF9_9CRUS|nr:Uncharacterized protein APZ42_023664 [Daphnia magna]
MRNLDTHFEEREREKYSLFVCMCGVGKYFYVGKEEKKKEGLYVFS